MARKGMGLLLAGAAALLLMGGKKKKKSSGAADGSGDTSGGDDDDTGGGDTSGGDDLLDPGKKDTPSDKDKSGNGGSGPGKKRPGGGNTPPKLAPDAIWVSPDCKRVFFADGRIGSPSAGMKWFEKKALPQIKKFEQSGYVDPYEIARDMILKMAPCASKFPLASEVKSPGQLEYDREAFLREYRDVYSLIMALVESAQSILGQDENSINFDPKNCDVTYVGENWGRPIAEQMINFYLNYMYPVGTNEPNHEQKHFASLTSDPKENSMIWSDNIAVAVINRFNPECGSELAEAFRREPFTAMTFFKTRPGLRVLYQNLIDLVNYVDNNRGGLDFNPEPIDVS